MLHALQAVAQNNEKAHRRENRDTDAKIHQCVVQNFRVAASGDQLHGHRGNREGEEESDEPPEKIENAGDLCAVADSFSLIGSEVLARVRRHARTEGVSRQHEHLSKTAAADLCGDVGVSECIDAALKDDASDVVDSVHECHGKAVEKDIPGKLRGGVQVRKGKAEKRIIPVQIEQSQRSTDRLCQDGCDGSALNTHVKRSEKPDIKDDIENA